MANQDQAPEGWAFAETDTPDSKPATDQEVTRALAHALAARHEFQVAQSALKAASDRYQAASAAYSAAVLRMTGAKLN